MKTLLAVLPGAKTSLDGETEVSAITCDSRQVSGGELFVALRGAQQDGESYIAEAISRGAVAVVGE
ncbi:MAG: UDP-N-acetylmuramoyl-L-alanyl-D-glutamate--2,6-diaminopimelate ligase, partial [Oscillospiraceae bacterium]|nr:UDP-N-acetylmuramoyl-L-alanyl-D-glutamate--2,6-diaminopimelate ligase [Oscillospiraceae bacterium]